MGSKVMAKEAAISKLELEVARLKGELAAMQRMQGKNYSSNGNNNRKRHGWTSDQGSSNSNNWDAAYY